MKAFGTSLECETRLSIASERCQETIIIILCAVKMRRVIEIFMTFNALKVKFFFRTALSPTFEFMLKKLSRIVRAMTQG